MCKGWTQPTHMWNPENSQDLLKLHTKSIVSPQWVSSDVVRGSIVKLVMSINGGNMNGYTPQDLTNLYDYVKNRIPVHRYPFMSTGDVCFCADPCDCSTRLVEKYDVKNINNIVLQALQFVPKTNPNIFS